MPAISGAHVIHIIEFLTRHITHPPIVRYSFTSRRTQSSYRRSVASARPRQGTHPALSGVYPSLFELDCAFAREVCNSPPTRRDAPIRASQSRIHATAELDVGVSFASKGGSKEVRSLTGTTSALPVSRKCVQAILLWGHDVIH